MHDPPRARIERVAPVHGAAIVPEHEIADAPLMPPRERFTCRLGPDFVEEGVGVVERQPFNICVAPSAQVQTSPPGFRMDIHERVKRARQSMDRIREEIRKEHGVLNIGIPAIREIRDE